VGAAAPIQAGVKVLAAALLLLTLPVGWLHLRDERLQTRLEPIASAIAGRDVEVDCQGFFANLLDAQARHGEVRFDANGVPEPRIYLTRPTCSRLRDFAGSRRHDELACLGRIAWGLEQVIAPGQECYERASPTIYAVLVLAHEAYHTAGVTNEATTNCYAIQAMAFAAARLGAAEDEALLLARAMAALAPVQRGDYATPECRAGARLDLHPETPEFPTELPVAAPLPLAVR
jgi:hypothetical protein